MNMQLHTEPFSTSAAESVDVLFCSNGSYLQHLAVAAVSLAAHSRSRPIRIHVMTREDDSVAETRLADSLQPFSNVMLSFHRVSDGRLATAFIDKYVSADTYLRLLAAEILPDSIHRVLYLDCDLVVMDDIVELADFDLGGKPLAAVADFSWDGQPERLAALGIAAGHTYVNAGVLLIDLDRWRRDRTSEGLFSDIARLGAKLEYYDQDIINIALQGQIALIDRRWNLQARIFEPWVRHELPGDHAATRAARSRPGIIHYTTNEKPWLFRPRVKKRALYFKFLDRTAWRGARPPLASAFKRAEYDVTRNLLKIGVDVYEVIPVIRRLRAAIDRIAAVAGSRRNLGEKA